MASSIDIMLKILKTRYEGYTCIRGNVKFIKQGGFWANPYVVPWLEHTHISELGYLPVVDNFLVQLALFTAK